MDLGSLEPTCMVMYDLALEPVVFSSTRVPRNPDLGKRV